MTPAKPDETGVTVPPNDNDGIARKWVVERHDEDDGSISWEVWDYDPANYRRVVRFNDGPIHEGRHAKADAEMFVRLARAASPSVSREAGWQPLDEMRALGWAVAVHNDYRQDGEDHTFWLFTHSSGRFVKGEGRTDVEAIGQAREMALAQYLSAPEHGERTI